MQRKEIEKNYIKKIHKLKKYDKAYFDDDKPIIPDKDYDEIKQLEIGKEESISLPRDFLCTAKSKVKLHIELKGIEHHKICELQKMIQDQKQFIVLHDETKSTWGKILECNLWILF